ncbi:CaiB/BaiF CoA-transferase family protein [Microbacterium sp. MPKO10]|uniref:CaiB/BaiF CoA transferase family protein n=1 Tax=Microbacterium sp. MPKO10 TaxID=2989818 RepID=UPI00223545A7|nr:CaiB/BaiF CoA-transferase family protein [Microbacterium sp. MPKO10]MCW4459902.1 CoA transferase [Microbacterium sp. MPKO10]
MARPLDGVTVIDFTQVMLGPSCTQALGDFGADVIKVERPGSGDLSRRGVLAHTGQDNPVFLSLNRNKRGIAVDLATDAGRAVILDLLRDADVVVSNFRPGVMERLGLDYDAVAAINPRIIWAAGSGFGASGPYAHKGGQDILGQAYSGVMKRLADPEHPVSIYATPLADYTAGQHLVQGILLALLHREKTGEGQRVEVSLYNSMLAMQMQEATTRLMYDQELNWALMPLSGCFPTATGEIVIVGAFKPNPLRDICAALGLADLSEVERFSTLERLKENRREIRQIIADRLKEDTSERWLAELEKHDVLCGPVRSLAEALADPQTAHNNMIIEFENSTGQAVRTIASPITMSEVPPEIRHTPPQLGEHSRELLQGLGYDAARIDALVSSGAVQ